MKSRHLIKFVGFYTQTYFRTSSTHDLGGSNFLETNLVERRTLIHNKYQRLEFIQHDHCLVLWWLKKIFSQNKITEASFVTFKQYSGAQVCLNL